VADIGAGFLISALGGSNAQIGGPAGPSATSPKGRQRTGAECASIAPGKMAQLRSQSARTMPLFWKKHESDVTQFITELKARKPTLEAEQRAGRARLWDRSIDRQAEAEWHQANVPQQPYVYQTQVK